MARGVRSFSADEDRLDLASLTADAAQNGTPSSGQISPLLQSLQEVAADSGHAEFPARSNTHENQLIHARLGIAGGLFAALRCRHAPTATHSLRVALGCSAWSGAIELSAEERDLLEVAALLHDVGKIGVPDRVLFKTGRLLPEELAVLRKLGQLSEEILAGCAAPPRVCEIIQYATARFDGSQKGLPLRGEKIPLPSRMLAIVDAFDSMTTDHVYRPAKSRERALAELYECAGTQFDPKLVHSFCSQFTGNQNWLAGNVTRRWLQELPQHADPLPWSPVPRNGPQAGPADELALFERKLIDNMHDGVVFVDGQARILLWNTGAERLTGVGRQAAVGQILRPTLLEMSDTSGSLISDDACSIAAAIASGVQSIERRGVLGRNGQHVAVDIHSIPVRDNDGTVHGATVLLHDASSESTLEAQCQALHAQVTKDPMTQVANRGEFDRMHESFIYAHLEKGRPCSLIMADIDHFKSINDTFGHQAGDEAILAVASLLKSMCRTGDLVARYGGEEFAILCADCNNATTAQRAEQIRKRLSEMTLSYLSNRSITASFGVTELQPGDTPETMLRRADRALLSAKDQGRNQVVQLGDGMTVVKEKKGWWPFGTWRSGALLEAHLVTAVPIEVAIEKLRGFIADHGATVSHTEEENIRLEVAGHKKGQSRRHADRPVCFVIELAFGEEKFEKPNSQGLVAGYHVRTRCRVIIRPRRDRDRRRDAAAHQAREVLSSLKAYLMAKEDDGTADPLRTIEEGPADAGSE